MASNTPFPEFNQTGDDKHDLETDIEDLTDYCIKQNWFDPLKETDAQKWTKPEKLSYGMSPGIFISSSENGL